MSKTVRSPSGFRGDSCGGSDSVVESENAWSSGTMSAHTMSKHLRGSSDSGESENAQLNGIKKPRYDALEPDEEPLTQNWEPTQM
jgi:hypothetical protein